MPQPHGGRAFSPRDARADGDYRVLSAGVGAVDGQPPSAHAVRALQELGIDISRQRSRMLTAEMVQQADYIFGMTHSHVDAITCFIPRRRKKLFCCANSTKPSIFSRRTSAIPSAVRTKFT